MEKINRPPKGQGTEKTRLETDEETLLRKHWNSEFLGTSQSQIPGEMVQGCPQAESRLYLSIPQG